MSNKELSTDVSLYESILNQSKELSELSDTQLPISAVFGYGSLGEMESFGGRTLAENSQLVDKALENAGELQNIWNHAHSQWAWRHINFSYHSPMKNMRQVAAEISSKKSALTGAKWARIKEELKLRKLEDKLRKGQEEGSLDYWREIEMKIQIAEMKESLSQNTLMIEGAMKDVLAMNEAYEQMKSKVSNFSEYEVEKEESISHLKRSLVQCIRDVRQGGFISKGEQEYMEQIGVNPSKIQKALRIYVSSEENDENWDVSCLYDFVDKMANELIHTYKVDQKVMQLRGMETTIFPEFTNTNKYALLKDNLDTEV